MEDLLIGFMACIKIGNEDLYRGAILITDGDTKPIEFRVTSPIKPTAFQKTLYGNILYEYIIVELVCLPLIRSLTNKPKFILVREREFLDADEKQELPIIMVVKEGEPQLESSTEPLEQNGGNYEPIWLNFGQKSKAKNSEIRNAISSIKRDITEPFDRIATATRQVHEQKLED